MRRYANPREGVPLVPTTYSTVLVLHLLASWCFFDCGLGKNEETWHVPASSVGECNILSEASNFWLEWGCSVAQAASCCD
ncbi:hypothetical protein V8C35DRAFT_306654 [Trichoderma chlorosporum]